jgi:uncharacterized protein (DUF1330 family)
MSAFFVVYINVTDPDQFTKYFQAVMPFIERRGGRKIAQGLPEQIEGTLQFKQAVVFEWPSRQKFLDYWNSEEYAQIKRLRKGAAEFEAVLIESNR